MLITFLFGDKGNIIFGLIVQGVLLILAGLCVLFSFVLFKNRPKKSHAPFIIRKKKEDVKFIESGIRNMDPNTFFENISFAHPKKGWNYKSDGMDETLEINNLYNKIAKRYNEEIECYGNFEQMNKDEYLYDSEKENTLDLARNDIWYIKQLLSSKPRLDTYDLKNIEWLYAGGGLRSFGEILRARTKIDNINCEYIKNPFLTIGMFIGAINFICELALIDKDMLGGAITIGLMLGLILLFSLNKHILKEFDVTPDRTRRYMSLFYGGGTCDAIKLYQLLRFDEYFEVIPYSKSKEKYYKGKELIDEFEGKGQHIVIDAVKEYEQNLIVLRENNKQQKKTNLNKLALSKEFLLKKIKKAKEMKKEKKRARKAKLERQFSSL